MSAGETLITATTPLVAGAVGLLGGEQLQRKRAAIERSARALDWARDQRQRAYSQLLDAERIFWQLVRPSLVDGAHTPPAPGSIGYDRRVEASDALQDALTQVEIYGSDRAFLEAKNMVVSMTGIDSWDGDWGLDQLVEFRADFLEAARSDLGLSARARRSG